MLEKWLPPPVAATPSFAVLDRAVLPTLIGDDSALVAEFLHDYRISAQQTAAEIRAALVRNDWKAVADGAHKLKSSSRSVGALALGESCAQLEQAGKTQDAVTIQIFAMAFERDLAAAFVALHSE
jgi:HPt (histidine-containing phosphotransfer) domain-containing protein